MAKRRSINNTSHVRSHARAVWTHTVNRTVKQRTEIRFRYDTHDTTFEDDRFLAATTKLWRERPSYVDRYPVVPVRIIIGVTENDDVTAGC